MTSRKEGVPMKKVMMALGLGVALGQKGRHEPMPSGKIIHADSPNMG